MTQPKRYRAILVGGLIVGILDITGASINSAFRGHNPIWVFQSVASGWLGKASFTGGLPAAALGAVTHFTIAFTVFTLYFLASRRVEFLVRQAVVCGALYGVAVYCFMYGVVLPLTFHRSFFHPLSAVAIAVTIHIFCVGLPTALIVRRYSR
jgi:hypothetical protein